MKPSLSIRYVWLLAIFTFGTLLLFVPENARSQIESTHLPSDAKSDGNQVNEMFLSKWDLGITLSSSADSNAYIYLRFYEWNLFDAVIAGEHTRGRDRWPWVISPDQQVAIMNFDFFRVQIKVVEDGAIMNLTVTNNSSHDWPEIAAIIPCLSPEYKRHGIPENPFFFDDEHSRTYFLGSHGLELLAEREIHFDTEMKFKVLEKSQDGSALFPLFSHKWPTSTEDAVGGLMVRESVDKTWVTGIAWDHFLSCQGHNPRKCMHLSARVGPLKIGETKTLRGKIYLLKGMKEDCVRRFRDDSRGNVPIESVE
jgi:hypothetical protein